MHISPVTKATLPAHANAHAPLDPKSVVIVGGGFAGAALAYHLVRQPNAGPIVIIERGTQLGRGIAYGMDNPTLRLNVPAARMSLDPSQPDDFVSFAGMQHEPDAFLPRALYGAYVHERLANAQRRQPDRLHVVRGEAVRIDEVGVRLATGERVPGARVVLATGIAPRRNVCSLPDDPRILDAWDESALARLPAAGRVLILGAGLSALDVLGVLDAAGHRHEVVILSRRGLLPRPHAATSGSFVIPAQLSTPPNSLRALVRWARAVVQAAVASGSCWQHALDALRPMLPSLWQALSAHDRRRFVRLLRPYWEVLRHRAPIDTLERAEARRARGELSVLAGRALDCSVGPAALEVTLRMRGGKLRRERFDSIVRCWGPALELDPSGAPLIAGLLDQGLARYDCAHIGISTADHGRLVDATGLPSERLFALGQLCRATRWETTSVPEIARDALELAELLGG
jgi:uncharacterized NAD(P)/FAD-binding protein YdhS